MDDAGTEYPTAGCSSTTDVVAASATARSPTPTERVDPLARRHARPRQHPPSPLPDADTCAGAAGGPLHLAARALPGLGSASTPRPSSGRPHGTRRARALRMLDRVRPPLRLPTRPGGADRGRGAGGGEIGVRIVASRGSMDLGVSDGGLPPDELVEELDAVLAETERLAGALHEPGPGARVQIAVAPCSPFSVTGRLMEESAALARRLGLPLHTHLAETVEEEAYCRELYGCRRSSIWNGWAGSRRRLVRALRPPVGAGHRAVRRDRHGRRALPDVEPASRRGRGPCARLARRGRAGRPGRRRLCLERAGRPVPRGEAGVAGRARPRRGGAMTAREAIRLGDARRRGGARPRRHRLARAGQAGGPRRLATDGLELAVPRTRRRARVRRAAPGRPAGRGRRRRRARRRARARGRGGDRSRHRRRREDSPR